MKNLLLIVAATLLLATQSYAGTVMQTLTVEADGTESNGTMSVQDGNLRIEMKEQSDDDVTLIYKQELSAMIALNHAERSYVVMDKSFVDQVTAQLAAAQEQMEEMMKDVPPEQRDMVKQMMQKSMPMFDVKPPTVDVTKLGDGGTVSGKPTVRYHVTYDGQPKQNLWITSWDQMDGAEELKSSFESMVEFMQRLASQIPMLADSMNSPLQAMQEIDGFPIRTEDLDNQGNVVSTMDVVSAVTQNLSSDLFEVPAGYKKQDMSGL